MPRKHADFQPSPYQIGSHRRDRVDASNGSVFNHIKYSSFSEVTYRSNSNDSDRFKFTGREYDMRTKLSYHRARYLDTPSGRWTSEAPIGFAAGDFNLYRYVGNSATNYVDPSGRVGERAWWDPLGWIRWADWGEQE